MFPLSAKADMSRLPRGLYPFGEGISFGVANRRAEMWMKSRDWLADSGGAQILDCDSGMLLSQRLI